MKYEIAVNPIGDGKIESALYEVSPSEFGGDIYSTIIQQVIDTREEQTKNALMKLGWTPPVPVIANMKCIVKGCHNWLGDGLFVGDLCAPCHQMLTTGNAAFSATFVGELYQKANQLANLKSQVQKLIKE